MSQTARTSRDEGLLRERNPLLFYSERGILYYSTPREESCMLRSWVIPYDDDDDDAMNSIYT